MKTIETVVYTYAELSDKAKEKARDWFFDGSDTYWAENVTEDAKQVGFNIASWNTNPFDVEGEFENDAKSTATLIFMNHGDTCDTYLAAKQYLDEVAKILPDEDGDFSREQESELDELAHTFRHALMGAYQTNLRLEYEYYFSEENVKEFMEANEYTFTEDGKRFG